MKKLAYGENVVYVSMTDQEFKGLAGKNHGDVTDGTEISLSHIKQKLDLVDAKQAELTELKTVAQSVVAKITAIGL